MGGKGGFSHHAAGVATVDVPAPPEPGGDGLVQAICAVAQVVQVVGVLWHHLKVPRFRHSRAELAHSDGESLAGASAAVPWRLVQIPALRTGPHPSTLPPALMI